MSLGKFGLEAQCLKEAGLGFRKSTLVLEDIAEIGVNLDQSRA